MTDPQQIAIINDNNDGRSGRKVLCQDWVIDCFEAQQRLPTDEYEIRCHEWHDGDVERSYQSTSFVTLEPSNLIEYPTLTTAQQPAEQTFENEMVYFHFSQEDTGSKNPQPFTTSINGSPQDKAIIAPTDYFPLTPPPSALPGLSTSRNPSLIPVPPTPLLDIMATPPSSSFHPTPILAPDAVSGCSMSVSPLPAATPLLTIAANHPACLMVHVDGADMTLAQRGRFLELVPYLERWAEGPMTGGRTAFLKSLALPVSIFCIKRSANEDGSCGNRPVPLV